MQVNRNTISSTPRFEKGWIFMLGFGVRFGRIVWQSLRFTRDNADLRSGFSFAGVAQW